MPPFEYTEERESKFNAGIAQTYRVHHILELINYCRLNPSAWNMEYNSWNYNLWFRSIVSLYCELDAFLSDDERKECEKLKQEIEKAMKKFPIHENKSDTIPNNPHPVLQDDKLDIFSKYIEQYELLVKQLGLKYKLLGTTKGERPRI